MTPTTNPQQPPGLLQNILNFLFGRQALQQSAQPIQPNPVTPVQNTNPLQDQVTQYMMNLKNQQEQDKKKKKIQP